MALPVIETAIMGGTIRGPRKRKIAEVKGLASSEVDYTTAANNIIKLRNAFSSLNDMQRPGGGGTVINNISDNSSTAGGSTNVFTGDSPVRTSDILDDISFPQ